MIEIRLHAEDVNPRSLDRFPRINHSQGWIDRTWAHVEKQSGFIYRTVDRVRAVNWGFFYLACNANFPVCTPREGSDEPLSGRVIAREKRWVPPSRFPAFSGNSLGFINNGIKAPCPLISPLTILRVAHVVHVF